MTCSVMMQYVFFLLLTLNQGQVATLEIKAPPKSQIFINDVFYGETNDSGIFKIYIRDIDPNTAYSTIRITHKDYREKTLTVNINDTSRNVYIDGLLTSSKKDIFPYYVIVFFVGLTIFILVAFIRIKKPGGGKIIVDNDSQSDIDSELRAMFPEFTFIKVIAEGGVGTICKVKDSGGNIRALKIMTKYLYDDDMINKFIGEGYVLEKIHENGLVPQIVSVYDYGRRGSNQTRPFILMEYIEGKNMQFYMDNKVFSLKSKVNIINQILDAVEKVHESKIIHRDLAPDNIIILDSKEIKIKLIDFGVAYHNVHWLTEQSMGNAFGKPEYMAPEQLSGMPVDYRSDYYSLGVVAYALLNGELPFKKSHQNSVYEKHVDNTLPDFQVDVPKSIKELIHDLLNKEPNKRPQSIEAIRERLNAHNINANTH